MLCARTLDTRRKQKKHTLCKKETQKCEKLRRARWLDDACDAMRWFEYNIRSSFFSCIHILTHSTLHHSDGPLWYLVFRARVLFLKYNFYQISFFSPLFIPFGVWSLSIFFHPPIWKSPVTKHWPFSLLRNYTYACKGSALSCMCAFHVILPYGHAEPLIMFLLRAHFLLISSLNSPAKRINELKQLKKDEILMVYIWFFFHVSCVGFSIKKTCLIV